MLPRRIRSSRYKSFIWHVSLIKSGGPSVHPIDARCLIAPSIRRSACVHVTCKVNRVWVSPTLKKREGIVGFIRPDDLYGYDPSHIGKDKEHLYICVYNNIYVAPRRRAARVRVARRVALRATSHPRGSRGYFAPFLLFF